MDEYDKLICELDSYFVDRQRLKSGLFHLDAELEKYRDLILRNKRVNYLTRKIKQINKKLDIIWEQRKKQN